MQNIDVRLRAVIEHEFATSRRFKTLQDATGIDANRWKAVWHGRQRVMPDMIEAIAKRYPQYAFWLAAGISDPAYGHVAPGKEGFPVAAEAQQTTTRYFQEAIKAKQAAMNAFQAWEPDAFDGSVSGEDWFVLTDGMLRSMKNIHSARTDELLECNKKVLLAQRLRQAELAMRDDMPDLDFDETEVALEKLKSALLPIEEHARQTGMVAEYEQCLKRVAAIDRLIALHRSQR
ncbi:protein of unknown function [Paraburkholderia kururiensis]|uniref:hypothetical protein n=1 Tax=Paraburkholderia kururiensis TaxID=984307 RepID=UPI0039A71829